MRGPRKMMLLFVLPRFAGLFKTLDTPLPPTTQFLNTRYRQGIATDTDPARHSMHADVKPERFDLPDDVAGDAIGGFIGVRHGGGGIKSVFRGFRNHVDRSGF